MGENTGPIFIVGRVMESVKSRVIGIFRGIEDSLIQSDEFS
jgi:hypothetical protein